MNDHLARERAVAFAARNAVDVGHWQTPLDVVRALVGLECALAIRIQAGQPALEAMNARMAASYADAVVSHARKAIEDGSFECPSPVHEAVFGIVADIVPLPVAMIGDNNLRQAA